MLCWQCDASCLVWRLWRLLLDKCLRAELWEVLASNEAKCAKLRKKDKTWVKIWRAEGKTPSLRYIICSNYMYLDVHAFLHISTIRNHWSVWVPFCSISQLRRYTLIISRNFSNRRKNTFDSVDFKLENLILYLALYTCKGIANAILGYKIPILGFRGLLTCTWLANTFAQALQHSGSKFFLIIPKPSCDIFSLF